MATLGKEQVDNIIKNDGWYDGDRDNSMGDNPRCLKIVQYNNQFDGSVAYGCVFQGEAYNRYEQSPACHNPKVIWEALPWQK